MTHITVWFGTFQRCRTAAETVACQYTYNSQSMSAGLSRQAQAKVFT